MDELISKEEFMRVMGTGERSEPIDQWVPRVAAILITLLVHAEEAFEDGGEAAKGFLREVTAKMPTEVLIAATMGMVEANKIMQTPGMTPELYGEVQQAFKDMQGE